MQIDPLAPVEPVFAAGRHHDLVGGDFVRVVDRALRRRTPELRVYAGETSLHFRLVVEEVSRRDRAERRLIEVGAPLQRHDEQPAERPRSDPHCHK